jgi:hypothetical protein
LSAERDLFKEKDGGDGLQSGARAKRKAGADIELRATGVVTSR